MSKLVALSRAACGEKGPDTLDVWRNECSLFHDHCGRIALAPCAKKTMLARAIGIMVMNALPSGGDGGRALLAVADLVLAHKLRSS